MGHADRPRLHNAFSLDPQSRRVCVPAARCTHSDPNTDCIAFGYAHGNSHCDADSDSDGNCDGNLYTETYAHTEVCTDTAVASYAAAPAIRP